MRLVLVRHGRSRANVEGRFQGDDDPLVDLGRRQARETAARLATRADIVALYASPLTRAAETAQVIGEALRRTPTLEPGLAEINVGAVAGLTPEEFAAQFPADAHLFEDRAATLDHLWPDGESGRGFSERVLHAYHRIVAAHRSEAGAVVVVSHGGPLAWIAAHLHDDALDVWPSRHGLLHNCSISEISIPANPTEPAAILLWNDVSHLTTDPDVDEAAAVEAETARELEETHEA